MPPFPEIQMVCAFIETRRGNYSQKHIEASTIITNKINDFVSSVLFNLRYVVYAACLWFQLI